MSMKQPKPSSIKRSIYRGQTMTRHISRKLTRDTVEVIYVKNVLVHGMDLEFKISYKVKLEECCYSWKYEGDNVLCDVIDPQSTLRILN
jgi:hypothetical protein